MNEDKRNFKASGVDAGTGKATSMSKKNSSKFGKSSNRRSTNNKEYGTNTGKFKDARDASGFKGKRVGLEDMNDPNWYTPSDTLMKDAARLWFSNPLGISPSLGIRTNSYNETPIPGIMSLRYTLVPGVSTNMTSALNMSARSLYSWIRHANSGSRNYEAPDLMIYILGMASIYSCWTYGCRLYSILRLYRWNNRYLPRDIFTSMGADYSDFEAHIADLRYYLNATVAKINQLKIPASLNIIKRWCYLNSVILKDDEDLGKAQIYVPVVAGYFKYDPIGDPNGGRLNRAYLFSKFISTSPTVNFANYVSFLDGLIDAMLQDEDCGIMSGDILKAFGEEGCYHAKAIDENLILEPIMSINELNQIHNTRICRIDSDPLYQQADGTLIYDTVTEFSLNTSIKIGNQLVDCLEGDTNAELIIELTRNVFTLKDTTWSSSGGAITHFLSLGSDICEYANIYYRTSFSNLGTSVLSSSNVNSEWNIDGVTGIGSLPASSYIRELARRSAFKYAPLGFVASYNYSTPTNAEYFYEVVGDVYNFAVLSPDDVRKLNELAILGLLYAKEASHFD